MTESPITGKSLVNSWLEHSIGNIPKVQLQSSYGSPFQTADDFAELLYLEFGIDINKLLTINSDTHPQIVFHLQEIDSELKSLSLLKENIINDKMLIIEGSEEDLMNDTNEEELDLSLPKEIDFLMTTKKQFLNECNVFFNDYYLHYHNIKKSFYKIGDVLHDEG